MRAEIFDADRDLMIERRLKAPRAALWRCWSEPDLHEQWFVPAPWKTKVHALDMQPGGAFDSEMIGPDGERFRSKGCFVMVETGHRFIFTDALSAGYRPNTPPFMTVAITMTDTPDDGTLYIAHIKHADAAGRAKHEAMGVMDGWNSCISQLESLAGAL